jgi:hypothetical protein
MFFYKFYLFSLFMECQIGHDLLTSFGPNYILFDINELKNMLYSYNEPVRIMYFANIFSFAGTLFLLLKN